MKQVLKLTAIGAVGALAFGGVAIIFHQAIRGINFLFSLINFESLQKQAGVFFLGVITVILVQMLGAGIYILIKRLLTDKQKEDEKEA